jgi:hypothetical protein
VGNPLGSLNGAAATRPRVAMVATVGTIIVCMSCIGVVCRGEWRREKREG